MSRLPRLRAFTLIELLLAIAIGSGICATAFVTVRVASQTVASSNRLSVENQLLATGVRAALDELDTWKYYDDPTTPGGMPLRVRKHPFFRFEVTTIRQTEDFNFDFSPIRRTTETYEEWWRRDMRTWCNSDPTQAAYGVQSTASNGDFGLIGHVGYTDATRFNGAEKRWRHQFCKLVPANLGYYALFDYAPPSLIYNYLEPLWAGDMARTPEEYHQTVEGGIGRLRSRAWAEDKPTDFIGMTMGAFFTVVVPDRVQRAPYTGNPDINRAFWGTWFFWDWDNLQTGKPSADWHVDTAYKWCDGRLAMLPARPTSWPDLRVSVRHFISNGRQFHTGTVLAISPVTGQKLKLYLSYTGTTLRGARRLRGLDGAWP
ncbi:MAG TPA: type II secretion system protein [Planctomycetota bacterium]|nr:type II secretion system protein [Planctomycetota bacterium]